MPRFAWATDVHLETVEGDDALRFCEAIVASESEALLLGGDIAEAQDVEEWLLFLARHVSLPIYFVLGNHDYYGSDIATVRDRVRRLRSPLLNWLPSVGCVRLTENTTLVGHGGWGDARLGNFLASPVILTDYLAIQDLGDEIDIPDVLAGFTKKAGLERRLNELGSEAADALRPIVESAVRSSRQIIVLTHVPPFREACWHAGAISDDDWLPGFSCKAMGDVLLEVASANPEHEFTVLCGHTHGQGRAQPLPNLHVHTSEAEYGQVGFRLVEVDETRVVVRENA